MATDITEIVVVHPVVDTEEEEGQETEGVGAGEVLMAVDEGAVVENVDLEVSAGEGMESELDQTVDTSQASQSDSKTFATPRRTYKHYVNITLDEGAVVENADLEVSAGEGMESELDQTVDTSQASQSDSKPFATPKRTYKHYVNIPLDEGAVVENADLEVSAGEGMESELDQTVDTSQASQSDCKPFATPKRTYKHYVNITLDEGAVVENADLEVSAGEGMEGELDQTVDTSQASQSDCKPFATPRRTYKHYDQKYRRFWETLDAFKGWLQAHPNNRYFAWCRVCQRSLRSRKKDLLLHAASEKHKQNTAYVEMGEPIIPSPRQTPKVKQVFQKSLLYRAELAGWLCEIPNNPSRGWCKFCASRLTPQLHFLQCHSRSAKHLRNEREHAPQSPPQHDIDGDRDEPKRDEEMMVRTPGHRRHRQWFEFEDDSMADDTPDGRPPKRAHKLPIRFRSRSPPPLVDSDFAGRVTYSIGIGNRKVGFIGAGQISQAIALGMLEQGLLLPSDVMVSAPTQRNLAQWRRWKCQTTNDNDEVMFEADIIFLAVQSAVLAGMISKLKPVADGKQRLVISVVPGVPRDRLLELLQERVLPPAPADRLPQELKQEPSEQPEEPVSSGLHVLRAAPNKMMSISQGFCAYCMAEDLPHALYLVVETMFSAMGSCVQVEESLMDAYSVMVSSGAAFTCAFIEAMVQAGVNQSIPWDDALKAASSVVCGTSQLLLRSGAEPSALRKAIATPGGTTIAALTALQRGGLDDAVVTAMEVACDKTADAGARV